MSETAFEAQRRTVRELREKQDAGEAVPAADSHITPKAAKRRAAEKEAEVHHPAFKKKKKSKKKTSTTN